MTGFVLFYRSLRASVVYERGNPPILYARSYKTIYFLIRGTIFSILNRTESFYRQISSNRVKQSPEIEHELIERSRKGDERAFAQLVHKYEKTVWGFAYKLCRNQEKAEESFQDTFVNVYRKLDQFDGRSKFSTWLYTIVANNCLMKHRKRKLEHLLESLDEPPNPDDEQWQKQLKAWNDSPIDSLMNAELQEQLNTAIQKLPDDYKAVFVLRDLEDRTAEETAKILKLSVPAVKSRLRRSRIFLRHALHDIMKHE